MADLTSEPQVGWWGWLSQKAQSVYESLAVFDFVPFSTIATASPDQEAELVRQLRALNRINFVFQVFILLVEAKLLIEGCPALWINVNEEPNVDPDSKNRDEANQRFADAGHRDLLILTRKPERDIWNILLSDAELRQQGQYQRDFVTRLVRFVRFVHVYDTEECSARPQRNADALYTAVQAYEAGLEDRTEALQLELAALRAADRSLRERLAITQRSLEETQTANDMLRADNAALRATNDTLHLAVDRQSSSSLYSRPDSRRAFGGSSEPAVEDDPDLAEYQRMRKRLAEAEAKQEAEARESQEAKRSADRDLLDDDEVEVQQVPSPPPQAQYDAEL